MKQAELCLLGKVELPTLNYWRPDLLTGVCEELFLTERRNVCPRPHFRDRGLSGAGIGKRSATYEELSRYRAFGQGIQIWTRISHIRYFQESLEQIVPLVGSGCIIGHLRTAYGLRTLE